jgi:dihydrofolate reductase
MGRLIYSMSVSLDGFAAAPDGSLEWALVDDELHAHFNREAAGLSASLYGRRMYELMAGYWPTAETDPAATAEMVDFGRIWLATPKVVFSSTLEEVAWNSRLVAGDAAQEVARLKAQPGFVMDVGGPTLAGSLLRAGLVDEIRTYVHPVVLGGGLPFFPPLDAPLRARLLETRVFGTGVILLRYETRA